MSVLVSQMIDDASNEVGDPAKQSVTAAQWLVFYNKSVRETCQRWDVLEFRQEFNLEPTELYSYPANMTRLTSIWVSDTPGEEGSFRDLGEIFPDQFRAAVRLNYPSATVPERYLASASWFKLYPKPQAQIVNGGRIEHFGIPDRVTDVTAAIFPLPDFVQDFVTDRMVMFGQQSMDQYAEAQARYREWVELGPPLQDRMNDRSEDRRSSLRTRGMTRGAHAGMS